MNKKQKDYKATLDFWNWARKQDKIIDKGDWPEFERITNLTGACAFCEYFYNDTRGHCGLCPLNNKICGDYNSWWDKWNRFIVYRKTIKAQINLQRKAAGKIYQATKEYYNKEFIWKLKYSMW